MLHPNEMPDIAHEYSSFVLDHWVAAQPDSSLRLALSAFSHAAFGRAMKAQKAVEVADKLYAQSIIRTQEEMKTLSDEAIDRLLLTIMFMSQHEVRTRPATHSKC